MNGLIVPRRHIYLSETDGELIRLNDSLPETLQRPLRVTRNGTFDGVSSGYRSAVAETDDRLYKLKGCRPHSISYGSEPLGSHTLSETQYEVEAFNAVREIFLREGFNYTVKPVGIWAYDIRFKGEPTSAGIYEVGGDTRIDELLFWLEDLLLPSTGIGFLGPVYEELGKMVGQRIRVLHNYGRSWDTKEGNGETSNAHIGNVIVFTNEEGYLDVAVTDVDDVLPANTSQSILRRTQRWELDFLLGSVDRDTLGSASPFSQAYNTRISFSGKVREQNLKVAERNLGYIEVDENSLIRNLHRSLNDTWEKRTVLREIFKIALKKAYRNPGVELYPISLASLMEIRHYLEKEAMSVKREIKQGLTAVIANIKMEKEHKQQGVEEREHRHWKRFDDCLGFSDGKLVRVAVYSHIPRVVVYDDGLAYNLDGISPELGEPYVPKLSGFKTHPRFGGEPTKMTPEQIEFHLREVTEAMRWWDSDMKSPDGEAMPRSEVIAVYDRAFEHGIESSGVSKEEKSKLRSLRDSLFVPT